MFKHKWDAFLSHFFPWLQKFCQYWGKLFKMIPGRIPFCLAYIYRAKKHNSSLLLVLFFNVVLPHGDSGDFTLVPEESACDRVDVSAGTSGGFELSTFPFSSIFLSFMLFNSQIVTLKILSF